MIGRHQSPRERAHSAEAWAALAWGAQSLGANPIPDEPARVPCRHCGGSGIIPVFGGHGYAAIPTECRACWGEGEIDA